jgi:hypothetical protein
MKLRQFGDTGLLITSLGLGLAASLSGLAETPAVYWAKRSQMPWN